MSLLLLITVLAGQANSVYIEFQNCLDDSILKSSPLQLQFVPYIFDAYFNTTDPGHHIDITIYGNVTGKTTAEALPPPSSPDWGNPMKTSGKIVNTSDNNPGGLRIATFLPKIEVLTYTPVHPPASIFCNQTRDGTQCPIAPVFDGDASDASTLRAFGFGQDLNSSFRFATIDSTFTVNSGELTQEQQPRILACISATITPSLGPRLHGILRYLPMAVLIVVAIGTVSAAILSPWGTSNVFKWTSNYGRDEDLLRLVTPGFGDCLQYIQFIFLSGALSLQYPGYFRPVVSSVNWSALMFNQSFVSRSPPVQNPRDGIYVTHMDRSQSWNYNSTGSKDDYGMTRLRQLTGISADEDVWAGMVIWLLVIIGIVLVVCQLGFLFRWLYRAISNEPEQDLRSKNWPFTGGNFVRLVCNYFLLPVVAISMFQLVVAPISPAVVTAMAVILLVAILAFAGLILKIIFAAKPRSHVFDDLPTLLLYGPLYNTYSDDAAPFALIPAMLTFIRAVAIGAVQPSGIAQLVILAICEVILILTLHAFRPFRAQTSMNAYHTLFASVRLIAVLLSVAFVPTLGVTEPSKGWIGYIILFLHAVVLVFGFLLNSIQTLIEVVARFSGAGADDQTGAATRGAFVKAFGMRQLSRRQRRPGFRNSMTSDAAILTDDGDAMDNKSGGFGRSRSISASSGILLNPRTPTDRMSAHLDRTSSGDPDSSMEQNAFSFLPESSNGAGPSRKPDLSLRTGEPAGFYRAPRQRRPTGDLSTPGARSRNSWASGEWLSKASEGPLEPLDKRTSQGRPLSMSPPDGRITPAAMYMRQREGSDPVLNDPRRPDVDYAVREVDFYYGVRGPALNAQPTRKLKTGPADPVGPVSSATGWFKNMFGQKTKEKGKGFEVVRSSRAPPQQFTDDSSPDQEPYIDSPQPQADPAVLPGQRTRSSRSGRPRADGETSDDDVSMVGSPVSPIPPEDDAEHEHDHDPVRNFSRKPSNTSINTTTTTSTTNRNQSFTSSDHDRTLSHSHSHRVSDLAPSLGPIDAGSSIHLPSRYNSRATTVDRHGSTATNYDGAGAGTPGLPRKSSKRETSADGAGGVADERRRVSTVMEVPERSSYALGHGHNRGLSSPTRVPFSRTAGTANETNTNRHSTGAESALSFDDPTLDLPPESLRDGPGHRPTLSNPASLAPSAASAGVYARDERPTSVGYVNQHRASDRITRGPGVGGAFMEGSEAEFVGEERRGDGSGR